MGKEVKGIKEVLEMLKRRNVTWATTVNRIQNSLWDTGVTFFGRDHHRVAYYNEMNNLIFIN